MWVLLEARSTFVRQFGQAYLCDVIGVLVEMFASHKYIQQKQCDCHVTVISLADI